MKNSETKEGELYSNSIWPESDTINPEIPDTDIQTILKEVDQELIKAITVEETGVREKIYDLLESINLTTKQDCLLYSQWITDTIGSDEFRNQTAIFYTDNDDGPRNGDSLLILLMLRPFQVKKVELGEQIDLFELFSALVTYCEKIRPDEIEEEKETADYYDKLSDQEATDSADSIVYNEQDWNFGQKNVPSDFEIELGTADFEVDSPDFKSSEIVHNTSQPKVPATYHDYRLDEMDSVTWHSHSLSLINEVIRCLGQYSNQKMIDLFLKMFDQYGTNISANADKLMNGDATYTANKIFDHLRNQDNRKKAITDPQEKERHDMLSFLLYRLEFGRLKISEDGIHYLDKVYDLGEYNRSDYKVQRLTPYGEIGVFDEKECLSGYFELGDLSKEHKTIKAHLGEITLRKIFTDPAQPGTPEHDSQTEILQQFKENYLKFSENIFFSETGVTLAELSLREQAWIINFLLTAPSDEQKQIIAIAQEFGSKALQLLVSLELDRSAGTALIELVKKVPKEQMSKLINYYSVIHQHQEILSLSLLNDHASNSLTVNGLSLETVMSALGHRTKDIIIQLSKQVSNEPNSSTLVEETLVQLEQESIEDSVISGNFRKLVQLFQEKPDNSVDLKTLASEQIQADELKEGHALYLRALHERGELKPIPEIHWRVDRSLEEYKRRFGFSIPEFLQALSDPTHKKLLLEFGPGSGASKQERAAAGILDRYEDVAMADALYYPLAGSIYNTLDWEKLTSKLGNTLPLIDKDKQLIAEMIYKAIMITDSEEEKPDFTYAQKRIQEITDNPRKLTEIITKIAPHLLRIENIPSTISTRDEQGNVIYPYKINVASAKERSLSFLAAKAELANNAETYLKKEQDPFQAIPAYPAGTIIGDFSKIKALKDNQVDVALGVRSTVYKRGEDYVEFMNTMVQKLAPGGVYIDDNVRDNDGWTYRLAELSQVQAECADPSIAFTLILGPGFPGEDYRQDEVPLAVVVSKGTDYHSQISTRLEPGYRLVSLTDYTADKQNLQTLDSTGYVLKTVAESEITRGPSVDARRSA